jgi:dienelactone hydrolase
MHWRCRMGLLLSALLLGAQGAAFAQNLDPTKARLVLTAPANLQSRMETVELLGGDGIKRPADIYFSATWKERRPAIVFVSGGEDVRAWPLYQEYGRLAVAHGFVGVVSSKRFQPGPGIAQGRDDTAALLDQIATLSVVRIDRARTCIWAFSAGGSALSLVYTKNAPPLACVIAFYPVLDVPAGRAPEAWRAEYAPVAAVKARGSQTSPSLLLVRAGKDSAELNQGISAFVSAALERNVPMTLVNLPAAHHAFDMADDAPWSRAAIEHGFAFAQSHTGMP